MFESIISPCRGKQTPTVTSSQYRGGVLSPDGGDEYHTLSYRGVSGYLVPLGAYTGCKWREGVTRLLLLRGVTSRLISFHFLSFHPHVSSRRTRKLHVRVHVNGAYSVVQSPGGSRESRGKTMPSCLRRDPFLVMGRFLIWISIFKREQNCEFITNCEIY